MERQAPQQLNYDDVLPIAIESKSQRREFFPEGGSEYGPNGGTRPNIVRIPINADSMLDVQNSYLKFDLKNGATHTAGMDMPQSYIKRLRILSGGTTLEDIDQYGRLYAGILYPSQASANFVIENSNTNKQNQNYVGNTGSSFGHQGQGNIAADSTNTLCISLASGLLNLDKYVPLVLMNAGLTIEIELDVAGSIGVSNTAQADWHLTNFRYVAHLIDLQRDFYDRLRMVMEGSGGVLQLAGVTYRHFSGTWASGATAVSINVPARVKSIKSILFKNTIEADVTSITKFGISDGVTHGLTSYQFRIGAVTYPPSAVNVSTSNKGEPLLELQKAFGNLADIHSGPRLLGNDCYLASAATGSVHAALPFFGPLGLDFESFPRTALENGVNTADRSLPITLELTATDTAIATSVDVYCMCDAIFYVNLDGTMSVSV